MDRARGRRSHHPSVERLEEWVLLSGDVILDWNLVALDAAAVDSGQPSPSQPGPTRTARALAIVHVAMFDAVNGIVHSYRPYAVRVPAPRRASIDAAASQAAPDTLAALYPRQRATFDAALARTLGRVPDGVSEILGARYGGRVAETILQLRQNDGSEIHDSYSVTATLGRWQPDPMNPHQKALTPGWGQVRPFALTRGAQYRPAAPPGMGGVEYAAAFDEVQRLGGDGVNTPMRRTTEQTEIGLFWGYDGPGLGTPPRLYNQVVRVVAMDQGNTLMENARLFALVNVAMADAGIAAWDAKYAYNYWRPITAIRAADSDGNPATVADPSWIPLGAPGDGVVPDFTPPFPAYPSGHATFGAATFRILTRFYGRDDVSFTLTSDEFDGVRRPFATRAFTSFRQAAEENGRSRIYLGIHWNFDSTEGIALGDKVADAVYRDAMVPVRRGPWATPRGVGSRAGVLVRGPLVHGTRGPFGRW